MNQRSGILTFFLFVFLSIIILFQILSMIRSDRLYEGINRLDDVVRGTAQARTARKQPAQASPAEKEYPGDDGDWLVWAFKVEPKTLNQISVDGDIYSRWMTTPNIFEPLLMYDFDEVKFKPHLAQSYTVSSDGLEITFYLRNDIYFSDGVPVTADDVIFTYETIMNPMIDAANLAQLFVDVDKVVKVDDRTIRFLLKRPYFKILENVCFWDIGIFPQHIYQFTDTAEFNKHRSEPTGSGPYVFERWTSGREIVLRRNENYWGPKPRLKKLVYRFIPNDVANLQALRSGDVDMIIPDPEQFADMLDDKEFNQQFRCIAYWTPATPYYYIGWNQDTPFFADRRVRLAMTHIVDREQIVSRLLKGNAQMLSGPFYIKGLQNDPSIKPWPYDLEKASKLLDEAGWIDTDGDGLRDKNGVPFRFKFMYSSTATIYQRLAKLLKDAAAQVGIEVIPDPYEWSIVISKLNDRDFESMVMGWGGDILQDPYQLWHSSQIGNRGSNYVAFRSAQADALMEKARRTIDDNARNKLYHQLHQMIHDEQPYTFLFARPTFRLVDRRFKNVIIHELGLNYLEWYVPKNEQRYK